MDGINAIKGQAIRLREDIVHAGQLGLSSTTVQVLAESGIHFLLAAVLAGGVVFEDFSPFGVAAVAGAGVTLSGGCALLGAALGYLTLLGFADGLRYLSAAILTFSVGYAFQDLRLFRRPLVLPCVAGMMVGMTGFVYLSRAGWRTQDVIFFGCEIALAILVGWGYRLALIPVPLERAGTREQPAPRLVAVVILLCAVLISLSDIMITADIALGRCVGAAIVLAVGWRLGCGAGGTLGVIVGLSLDFAALGSPLYAMALGVAGVVAGFCRGRGRILAILSFVFAGWLALLWTWERGLKVGVLYEVLIGGLSLCVVPTSFLRQLDKLAPLPNLTTSDVATQQAGKRLSGTASAFRAICDCLRQTTKAPPNDNDVSSIFDRATERVCRTCRKRSDCWAHGYQQSRAVMNDATPHIVARGYGESSDFADYFSGNCLHFPEFLSAINEEFSALCYRKQYQNRIRESRTAVCRQYAQLSTLLGDAAETLGQIPTPDPKLARRLHRHLIGLGLDGAVTVQRDHRKRLRAEIHGRHCNELLSSDNVRAISALMRAPLHGEETEYGIVFTQQEPLMAVAGVAARRKSGEAVSGDAGCYFKGENGTLYLLLCDGMGCGEGARQESALAISLLEQFLKAGVSCEQALTTLTSALGLRGEDGGGFTTVDLLNVDLFTGEGGIYKLGAAPTYIRHNGETRRIVGTSLPAGLELDGENTPDFTRIQLSAGDCILMISDGIATADDDSWLMEEFSRFDGKSPKILARSLAERGGQQATDDKTALVVCIEPRE